MNLNFSSDIYLLLLKGFPVLFHSPSLARSLTHSLSRSLPWLSLSLHTSLSFSVIFLIRLMSVVTCFQREKMIFLFLCSPPPTFFNFITQTLFQWLNSLAPLEFLFLFFKLDNKVKVWIFFKKREKENSIAENDRYLKVNDIHTRVSIEWTRNVYIFQCNSSSIVSNFTLFVSSLFFHFFTFFFTSTHS